MKRIFGGVILSIFMIVMSFAYDFFVGGIYYQTTSDTTCLVVCPLKNHYYMPYTSGDVEIPDNVTNNGKSHSATSIGNYVFEKY